MTKIIVRLCDAKKMMVSYSQYHTIMTMTALKKNGGGEIKKTTLINSGYQLFYLI